MASYQLCDVPKALQFTIGVGLAVIFIEGATEKCNGTARFKECKQLFKYQHLLIDIWGLYHKTYYDCNLQFL